MFIEGNRLAQRFAALSSGDLFVIGETGTGTALNLLLAARLFLDHAPEGARLALVSSEKHPLGHADLARCHEAWSGFESLSTDLRAQWPEPTPGFHRVELHERIDVTLMFGDSLEMWRRQRCDVDAWFLDGFAPARNPSMWSEALFGQIALRSAPGATLASFTVAGAVRRGLEGAGFTCRRLTGFGRKRHRLEAVFGGHWSAQRQRRGHALVAGAGLAGACTARALARRGWTVTVADPAGVARAASGNRLGVVYTTPSGIATPQNRFYQASYLLALRRLGALGAGERGIGRFEGVVQHATSARHAERLWRAAESRLWPPGTLVRESGDAFLLPGGGFVEPPTWCRLLLGDARIEFRPEALAAFDVDRGRLDLAGGAELDVDALVLCCGAATTRFRQAADLPLRTIRGQVTEVRATPRSRAWRRARCHRGYVTPAWNGLHSVGATFDLHGERDGESDIDDRENLAALADGLPGHWQDLGGECVEIAGRRAAHRCQAADYLPLAGALEPQSAGGIGPWLNVAHGSRGLSSTPLCADLVADSIGGLPLAVDEPMERALAPARFAARVHRGPR